MSKYHQSSNPFESDEDEGDFIVVGKTGSSNSQPSAAASSSRKTSQYSDSRDSRDSSSFASSTSSSSTITANRSSTVSPSNSGHSYSQRSHQHYSGTQYNDEEDSPFDDRRHQLQMKIANSENTQLESTQRALASIYDSEAMGITTAEELLRQGETLNNIESKTDSMQQNMKMSQRHLNNIKSVFGGIKNWWSGGDKKAAETNLPPENANSKLRATIEKTDKSRPDVSGFYDNDNDLDSRFMAGARKPEGGQYTMISPVTRSGREEEIDSNLGMMSDGMSRLKGLAMGLGDEIERQNEQLDRINVKVDKTDTLLTHQNTQMRRILKK